MQTTSLKILIISGAFYPKITPRAFRTTELVKELAYQGHDVTLLTVDQVEEQKRLAAEYGFKLKELGPMRWKPILLAKTGLKHWITRGLRRLGLILFEYPNLELMWHVKRAMRTENGYDLLISIAAPHPIHWGVAWARKDEHRIANIWVADCGDPYMGQENDNLKKVFYFKYLEKWFCQKADFISVPMEGSIQGYYPEFHHKIRVIPQGFDFRRTRLYKGSLKNDVVNFAYAGGFIPGRRDPGPILEFLLSTDTDFRFHIYTKQLDLVQHYAEQSRGRIIVEKVLPRETLLYELSHADFLLNIENAGTRQKPSKLIDYAITGRPILSINSNSIDKDKIVAFLNRDYRSRYDVGDIDQYRIENVVSKFLQCYDEHRP